MVMDNSPAVLMRPDGTPLRVLVVDDEEMLAQLLGQVLERTGWQVQTATDGFSALRLAEKWQPDLAVLDIMMPSLDGYEVLERLHKLYPQLPALFLTAKDSVEDRVTGLRAGADDYVTKPYSIDEVQARLEVLARRAGFSAASEERIMNLADVQLNCDSRQVTRGGTEITLTKTEFDLLEYFMENPNKVLSKTQILQRVWSYDFGGQSNVVELYVSYLRKKLDALGEPLIHTMRGVGYVMKAPR